MAAPKSSAPKPTAPSATEAADIPSARVAARLSGKRVEALSERTESSRTWANKDGSLTTEMAAGPERFKRNNQWVDVDVAFAQQADGSVASNAHPVGLKLAGAGGTPLRALAEARTAPARDLVTLGAGGQQIALGWKGGLPAPRLDGYKASYPEAVPGADLVVEATRTGFEQFMVIKQRPTVSPYSYTMPLKTPGLKVARQPDGSVLFMDKKTGQRKAVMPAPVMWDAKVDNRSGEHTNTAPVTMQVVQKGASVDLVLTPDAKFLADATYPVTVDPSTGSLGAVFDTFVQRGETIDRSTSTDLLIGWPGTKNPDQTTRIARSFMTWNAATIANSFVSHAELKLFNHLSGPLTGSCAAREWQVWAATQASTATRWTNQPNLTAPKAVSTQTRSKPGCNNAGYVTADVTELASAWASARAGYAGMGIRAGSETDISYFKRFYSGNAASPTIPKLVVTYNYRPKTGTELKAGPPFFEEGGVYYVNTTTPTLQYRTGDANGDDLKGYFDIQDAATGARVGKILEVDNVPAGQIASVQVPANLLVNGKTYKFKVTSYDYEHYDVVWSPLTTFVVDTTRPSAPTGVTSSDYPSGQWVKGAGQPGTFTATPPAGTDHKWLEWSLDGASWTKVLTNGAPAAKSFAVTPPKDGSHTLQVRAVDKADNSSEPVPYVFHAGPGGFDSPASGVRTARRVPLIADTDGSKYDKVSFSWRRSDADPWTPIPPGHVRSGDDPVNAWPVPLTNGKNTPLTWAATDTVNPDGTVQLRAEFTGPNNATGVTEPISIVVDRNADGAASTEVGPGSVNLLTGEYTLSATDASLFGLSVSRTASSRRPDTAAAQDSRVAIFGKEWTSGVSSEDVESSNFIRKTSDTSLDVVDEDGTATHFTANEAKTGWVPEPGAESLALTGTFSGSFTMTDTDGTVTTFTKAAGAETWQVSSSLLKGFDNSTTKTVSEAVTVGGKTLTRPKRLIAPTSAATATACETHPATRGCRVLEFGYATTTTATDSKLGDVVGQVSELRLWATNPGATAATATVIAKYAYDAAGRLRETWDPRISPPLKTTYTYDDAGRVTTLTPPGQLPWTFSYGKAGNAATAGEGMLLRASRPALKPGTVDEIDGQAVTSVVYDVPLTGSKAPHKLGAADTKAWGQTDVPTDAAAVFPADAAPGSHTGDELSSGDYRRATLTYLDASGLTVNTVAPGGHVTTTEHDKFGNTVRELSAANRALALGGSDAAKVELSALGISGLATAERAQLLSTRSVFDATGARELEELGPLHRIGLEKTVTAGGATIAPAGAEVAARSRTVNEYDAGRPTDGTAVVKDRVTKATVGAQLRQHPDVLAEARVTVTDYDWAKGVSTRTVQDPAGLSIAQRTQYDDQGRVTKTLMPESNGTDAGATISRYYTADGTGPCGGRPEWADQLCQTEPAGAITGGGTNPSQLITKRVEYNRYGAVAKAIETANGVTRTTSTEFDDAGRPTTVTVTGGLGEPVPAATTEYDPATGQTVNTVSPTGGTIRRVFDKLGRQVSYTDADDGATRREYDKLNRPTKVTDSAPSTTTYAYDSGVEPRGLATGLTDSVAGTFTARYDAGGSVRQQGLPGGYTLRQETDPSGTAVSRAYTRNTDSALILADATVESVHSQQLTRIGGSGQTTAQKYRYDPTGRLTTVEDTSDAICTRRSYGFDKHSNRRTQTTAAGSPDAACPTSGGATVTHTYDSADRIVNAGYVYDAFGRTTSMPGGMVVGYHANDLARTMTTGGARQTWTLDGGHRFRAWTTESNNGGGWQTTSSKRNHYGDDTDSPRWIVENTATGDVSRNVESLTGDLAVITANSGDVQLQLTNLHGDVNLVLPLDAGKAPAVLDSDEYGNPRPKQRGARYGWLGVHQRSAETAAGIYLMGVRLYNPQTGRFLSVDPVPGGNANAYTYPVDPINQLDLDGRRRWFKRSGPGWGGWLNGNNWTGWAYSRYSSWVVGPTFRIMRGTYRRYNRYIVKPFRKYVVPYGRACAGGAGIEFGKKHIADRKRPQFRGSGGRHWALMAAGCFAGSAAYGGRRAGWW